MEINLENVVNVMFDDFLEVEAREGFEDELEKVTTNNKKHILEVVNLMTDREAEEIIAEKLVRDLSQLSQLADAINLIEEVLEND